MSSLAIAGILTTVSEDYAKAQITPDTTLGNENSTVTSIGSVDQINGGATRGANLFHSFQEFNVDSGRSAFFTNPAGIENILTRVTGAKLSNILGTLGVSGGNANLFLMNPNGIIFGPNARLDVRGSFVGTTANAMSLASGDIFSANPVEPLPTSLLNVNPNAFFFNQIAAVQSTIINRSITNSKGLQVPQSQSLLLVGGDVSLEGGQLQALGGRVELGGLAAGGSVGLSVNGSRMSLSFPNDVARADVYLTNGSNTAGVNVAASNGGSIAITAGNINMSGGSLLSAGLEKDLGFPDAQAGDIKLHAQEAINIANGSILNSVQTGAVGKGGNIDITTGSLFVTDGAQLFTRTYGRGDGGSVTITARDTVSFDGVSSNEESSGVFSRVETKAVGNSGGINITTGSLSVTNGAELRANTFGQGNAGSVTITARDTVSFHEVGSNNGRSSGVVSRVEEKAVGNSGDINVTTGSLFVTNGAVLSASTFGQGDGGNVIITARDTVSFDGATNINGMPSGAFSTVRRTAVGNGGDINITTRSLSITNSARLSTRTLGQGDGGNITLNANTLEAVNGGQVLDSSLSSGKAGNIILNVSDSVIIAGSDHNYFDRLARFGEGTVSNSGPKSGLFANTTEDSTAQGGNVKITTGQLIVQDGAQVSVSSEGSGNGGELLVWTGNLVLDNQGNLRASTASGEGGNIELGVRDVILMRRDSLISAEAGGTGNGGNITINTPFIISAPSENNDIVANAVQGRGGNINVNTQGIYGLENRDQLTEESDITASSQFGVDGVVEINTLDVDPSLALVTLSAELVDASRLIASSCGAGRSQAESEFIITGRGGLPSSPSDTLSSDTVWTDLRPTTQKAENFPTAVVTQPTNPTAVPLVEAQGWVINNKGEVVLTATAPTVTPHSPGLTTAECHTP